jgi:hypothetical protein
MKAVIVAIAKMEHDYIEEWLKYHLHIGFDKVFLYDNEDIPTYKTMLSKYSDKLEVFHLPRNNYSKGVQYIALDNFTTNYMRTQNITHVVHIDIDEFIVLKKHSNIHEFIKEYIKDNCAGIGINWRLFGDSGLQTKTENSVLNRFTKCERKGNQHIKTIFDIRYFKKYNTCHDIDVSPRMYIKSTDNKILSGPFNKEPNYDVIQLNHYKCKTIEEFKRISTRGRAGRVSGSTTNIINNIEDFFNHHNINEIEDLHAYNIWQQI